MTAIVIRQLYGILFDAVSNSFSNIVRYPLNGVVVWR